MISPINVEYPNDLGGGECGGCPVVNEFVYLTGPTDYKIISDSEIVRQTIGIEYYSHLCESGIQYIREDKKCNSNFLNIIENGYRTDLEKRDMIQVEERNGKYFAVEGKHRVCAMKRNGYDIPVPMIVTHSKRPISKSPLIVQNNPIEAELDRYYEAYKKYGMNREEVRDYLNSDEELCKIIYEKNKNV